MTNVIVAAVVVGILYFGWTVFKASKDPNVQTASTLRMTISRFKHYERLYDEYDEFMQKHGIDSHDSDEFFAKTIWPQISNPNEWRRYQQYRYDKAAQERHEMLFGRK